MPRYTIPSTEMSTTGGGKVTSCGNDGDGAAAGCTYPDEVIMEKGVTFNVRYTGCVEVTTSMKELAFSMRTQIARECINRVCEAAGLTAGKQRRGDKKAHQYISDRPCMVNAGTNCIINVNSRELRLINSETGMIMIRHEMPRISFASGGDNDTLDFLAYVAKREDNWRACFVLECFGGQSEDLIVTIGKAFMLRFNALNKRSHAMTENTSNKNTSAATGKENEKDYYNDLPDKLPPDLLPTEDMQHQQQQSTHTSPSQSVLPQKLQLRTPNKSRDRLSSNLIDLNSPPAEAGGVEIASGAVGVARLNLSQFDPMLKENSPSSIEAGTANTTTALGDVTRDVFDLPPYSLSVEMQLAQLRAEPWYHGAITRPTSESLLVCDGDFLVREAQGKIGQYVLTGLEGRMPKHLLLINPEGVVRTKDRIFDSISHLINYHWTQALPIISEDSELVLRNPVPGPASTAVLSANEINHLAHLAAQRPPQPQQRQHLLQQQSHPAAGIMHS